MKRLYRLAALALLVLAGCAADGSYEAVNRLLADVPPEQGLERLEQAVKKNPRNSTYRAALLRERERVAAARLREGDAALRAGRLDEAKAAYTRAVEVDPDGYGGTAGLKDVDRAQRHAVLIDEAKAQIKAADGAGAETRLRTVLSENPYQLQAREMLRRLVESNFAAEPAPKLKNPYKKPITLEFRDTQIRTVFEMLARTSGINFVFDRDVKQDTKVTIYVRNSNLEDIMKLVFVTNQLDAKVLNDNSVLVYPNTPAKQKDYRELVVRSFYLANADVKQASAMVKSMVKTQDVFIDEKLNLLVVKDTPDVVRLTEQLVRTLDVAEPEVMLEVEVIEVTRSRLQDIGINYPGSVQFGVKSLTGAAGSLQPFNADKIFKITDPALTFNLRATVGTTNLLANPRIRVRNKEKARIHIGDKVPQFTTTSAVNVGVATSVNYIDVGLKLDIEAQVYLNDEVGIKVGLEVSNIVEQITTNGAVAYRLGTRNTNTVLQLRDGETQVLAGLINDEDRRSAQRIPGLGDLPLLSRLFGTQQDNRIKNEIMLLITPRIVRNISRPEGVMAEMPVGTDSFPGLPPLRIARTAPGALAMKAGTGGAAASNAPILVDETMNIATPVLGLAAPPSARSGSEFMVTVTMPGAGQIRAGQVELSYDAKALVPVGIKPLSPGRVGIELAGGASKAVHFKVLATAAGTTLIAVAAAEIVDDSGFAIGVEVPPPANISITP